MADEVTEAGPISASGRSGSGPSASGPGSGSGPSGSGPISAAGTPAPKAPPKTIVIVDESLASYEAEQTAADQTATGPAATGRTAADDWTVADAATGDAADVAPTSPVAAPRGRIVIVDDSIYDDDFVLENGTAAEAVTGSDDVFVADGGVTPADEGVSAETSAAPDGTTVTGSDDPADVENTADAALADVGPAATDAGVSAETSAVQDFTTATYSADADDAIVGGPGPALTTAGVSAETPAGLESSDEGEAAALRQPAPVEADALPVPTYDSLSLPSLRARLRNLDIDQVRMLADYERAHAARADVITMFERRIDKLAAGQ